MTAAGATAHPPQAHLQQQQQQQQQQRAKLAVEYGVWSAYPTR